MRVPPAEILFGRLPRNRLPDLKHSDDEYKRRIKEHEDRRRRAAEHGLQVGDCVYVKRDQPLLNKTLPLYDTMPYKITHINGSMVTAASPQREITRNSSFFRRCDDPPPGLGSKQRGQR